MTGTDGSFQSTVAIRSPSLSAASHISAQCDGTDTASFTAFFTPSSASRASARSTASVLPAITSWPGELKLAGATTCPCATSSHTAAICASSPPRIAAIAPTPAGTAACIKRPRSATSAAASCSDNAPAHTSALYSPRLWPASCAGCAPPSACHTRHTATLAASNAGWVFSVLLS